MSFLDKIKRTFNPSFYNSTYTSYTLLPGPVITGYPSLYRDNATVTICARILANTVASIPINIVQYDDKGFKKALVDDYRFKTLHRTPNGYTNNFNFWHTMEFLANTEGNSFAIIHKFPETKSISLELVHPSLFVNYFFKNGFLKYTFKTSNGNKEFDANEIIHFKRNSIDSIMGISAYDVLKEQLEIEYYANSTIQTHYKSGGKGSRFLKTTVTTGDINKLKEQVNRFRKETGGSFYDDKNVLQASEFSSTVAFPQLPGNTEIQVIPENINDALYLSTIQACDLKFASHFGIPSHYLNILQAQKNSNVEALQLDFKSSTIKNLINSNRMELEQKLLTSEELDKGYAIEYNTMASVELDHMTRLRGYESLQKTARLTPNEVRQEEGLPWIEGGDSPLVFDQFTKLENIDKDNKEE